MAILKPFLFLDIIFEKIGRFRGLDLKSTVHRHGGTCAERFATGTANLICQDRHQCLWLRYSLVLPLEHSSQTCMFLFFDMRSLDAER